MFCVVAGALGCRARRRQVEEPATFATETGIRARVARPHHVPRPAPLGVLIDSTRDGESPISTPSRLRRKVAALQQRERERGSPSGLFSSVVRLAPRV